MIVDIDTLHTAFSSVEDEPQFDQPRAVRAYSREEAEVMSGGMDCRTMRPDSRYAFMTCQIGKLETDTRFYLMAFGATWNAALTMLALKQEKTNGATN